MKATKTSSKTSPIRIANYWVRPTLAAACIATLVCLTSVSTLHATVLDNFTGTTPTGWTTTLNGGTIAQSGVYTITTGPSSGNLTYGLKTGSPFSVAPGVELEFRVDVTSVTSGGTSPQKILGWVPTGGALLANGYSVAVSETAVAVYKDATVLTNVTGLTLPNNNLTIALRMSGSGGAVKINARVYQTISPGVIALYNTCLAETTVVDSSGEFVSGSAALGVKSQSAGAASVAYDNLLVFNTTTVVLDSFSSGSLDTTKWSVFRKFASLGDSVAVGPTGLECKATLTDASGGFAGVYTKNNVYSLIDGGKVEFQVDMVNNVAGDNSYSALGYLPIPATPYIYGIVEYHIANDLVGTTITLSGKCYNEWWGGNDVQPPTTPPGARYIMTMTAEGGPNYPTNVCRIESRIEDLSVADVNDPARVVWQTEFIDTAAADPGLNETSSGTIYPYTAAYNTPFYGGGMSPRFSVSVFNAGLGYPAQADVIFSNAVVRQTAPPPSPPIIANLVPNAFGSNFMSTSALVAFDVTDANNLDAAKVTATLNGVTYKNGDTGVTITGGGTPSVHYQLSGVLTPNVNYVATFQATNSLGLTASVGLLFDTFLSSDFTIECEDYNFTTSDYTTFTNVAQYIDNPALFPDGFNDPTAYNTRYGTPEVDFHDNRGTVYDPLNPISDANHTFRYDYPYNAHSSDFQRAAYVTAGVPETDVGDIYAGDWMNYTKTLPSGTFNVFLREDVYKLQDPLVTLEQVSNPAATAPQTKAVLGTFTGLPTGLGLYENVTLTDGTGSPMILRLGGVGTLQLNERITGNASLNSGYLAQNYLVFVPVADPGTLRPVVSLVTPLANSQTVNAAALVSATIANRDTTVVVGTIGMKINGVFVASTSFATNNGAYVFYTLAAPLPPPGSVVTNVVYYQDSGSVWTTNTWTWTAAYTYLSSSGGANGSMTLTGFDARLVVSAAANLGSQNNVSAARSVLAGNYAVDLTSTNIVPTVAWDLAAPGGYAATASFPGECTATAYPSSFAVEVFTYLHLTAGAHFFHVDSDDAVGIYSGTSLTSDSITLVENNGVTHADFSFVTATDGLYPIHIIYEEGGPGAYLVLTCTDTGTPIVVNTAGAPTAYYPFVVQSSSSPTGPWTSDAAANAGNVMATAPVPCDGTGAGLTTTMTGGTVTFPLPGSPKFYRFNGPRPTKITSWKKIGTNLVMQYTGQ